MSPGGIHVCSLGVAIVDCELFALSPGDGVTTLLGLLGSGPGLENCGEHVGLCTTCSGCTRSCVTAACSFEPPYWLLNLRLFHDVRGDGGGRGDSAEDCALWRNSPRVRILSHFALLCAKSSKKSAPREGRHREFLTRISLKFVFRVLKDTYNCVSSSKRALADACESRSACERRQKATD